MPGAQARLERVDEARVDDVAQFEVDAAGGPQAGHFPVIVEHHLMARDVHQDHLAGGCTIDIHLTRRRTQPRSMSPDGADESSPSAVINAFERRIN